MKTSRSTFVSFLCACLLATFFSISNASAAQVNTRSSVPYMTAMQDAQRVASMNARWEAMRASGLSMAPYYADDSILLVERSAWGQLREGMIIVYADAAGDLVGHTLVRQTEAGWVARGVNNDGEDPALVTRENFVGVIFGVFNTAGLPESSTLLAEVSSSQLPVVLGKRY